MNIGRLIRVSDNLNIFYCLRFAHGAHQTELLRFDTYRSTPITNFKMHSASQTTILSKALYTIYRCAKLVLIHMSAFALLWH